MTSKKSAAVAAAPVATEAGKKDTVSKASSVITKSVAAGSADSELDEEDEWAAI